MSVSLLQKATIVIAFLCLIFCSFIFYQNRFSLHFVDEEDNLVLGYYLNGGELIYKDLFSHHQPLAYIFSSFIQKVKTPANIYSLIERHREFMIFWSMAWGILLLVRFRIYLVFFIMVFELSKFFLLGNLFLAESLAVYPTVYLMSSLLIKKQGISLKETFFMGVCFGLTFFLISPLWPFLFLFLIIFLRRIWRLWKHIALFLVGIVIWLPLVLNYIGVADYLENTLIINAKYYIPSSEENISLITLIKSFTAPIISLFVPINSEIVWLIRGLSVFLLITLVFLIKRKMFSLLVIIILSLGISNIRYFSPGLDFYRGFHLLPWFSLLALCVSVTLVKILKEVSLKDRKLILIVPMVFALSFYAWNFKLLQNKDVSKEAYINYSRQFDFGEVLNVMKDDGDTLFVAPDEWLIYYQAQIRHASYLVNYYPWMRSVPKLRNRVATVFVNSPPIFVYCGCQGLDLERYLGGYTQLKRYGKLSELYVIPSKLAELSPQQKNKLDFFGFEY